MVASFDLARYEPPLDYLLTRIERLVRLLDGHVDPGFVRRECAELLHEVIEFCRARTNFGALEAKVRAKTAIDTDALERALRVIEEAPRSPAANQRDPADRFENIRKGIDGIRANQHRRPLIETLLRLEIAFESAFLGGQIAILDHWDPAPLIELVRVKLEILPEQRLRDLWGQVLREFYTPGADEDVDDHADGYGLVDHGMLPPGFLDPQATDLLERLTMYNAWHRSRVVRAMLNAGQTGYPIPTFGIAKIVANQTVFDAPTATELAVARAIGNIAGWLSLRHGPLTMAEFAARLGIDEDSSLLQGEVRSEFEKAKPPWQGDAPERAALHSLATLASSVAAQYENETPMGIALFQYKAGIELFAPTIAGSMSRREVVLQQELCKFLLERGIFSVGTKFGQNQTDLVANVRDDYIVVECKVLKTAPSPKALQRNVAQLLRYDSLNPAFRGRRAVLVLYNFTSVPILTPRELVAGRAWVVAINAKAGPPSKTGRCMQLVTDAAHVLRCDQLGVDRRARPRRRRR